MLLSIDNTRAMVEIINMCSKRGLWLNIESLVETASTDLSCDHILLMSKFVLAVSNIPYVVLGYVSIC